MSDQDKPTEISREAFKADGARNEITGLGTSQSVSMHTRFVAESCNALGDKELEAIYIANGLGARIVDLLPDTAASTGFHVTGAEEFPQDELQSWAEDLDVPGKLNEGTTWGRLFGGGAVLMFGDGELETEVGEGFVPERLEATDKTILTRWPDAQGSITRAPGRDLCTPEFYQFTPPTGTPQKVHHSRVIAFLGIPKCPIRVREEYDGWSPSILLRTYDNMIRLASALGYAGDMLHTMSMPILKVSGLANALKAGGQSKADAQQAVRDLFNTASNLRAWLMDASDAMEEFTRTFSGADAILEHLISAAVRDSEAPRTVLLNEQPAALNAGADGEMSLWRERVQVFRTKRWTPAIVRICGGKIAELGGGDSWKVEWDDLTPKDEERDARIDQTRAATDKIYYDMGVYEPWEIRQREIAAGRLVEVDKPEDWEDPEPEATPEQMAALQAMQAPPGAEEPDDGGEAAPEDPEAESEASGEPEDEPGEEPGDEDEESGTGAT